MKPGKTSIFLVALITTLALLGLHRLLFPPPAMPPTRFESVPTPTPILPTPPPIERKPPETQEVFSEFDAPDDLLYPEPPPTEEGPPPIADPPDGGPR